MAAYQIPASDLTAYANGFQPRRTGIASTVTCEACGCRLQPASTGSSVYRHFSGTPGHDARGCSVACATADHDVHGSAIVSA